MLRKKPVERQNQDDFEGGVDVGESQPEIDALEGYAVIVQETLEAAERGEKGLQVPGYAEYKRDYLSAEEQA